MSRQGKCRGEACQVDGNAEARHGYSRKVPRQVKAKQGKCLGQARQEPGKGMIRQSKYRGEGNQGEARQVPRQAMRGNVSAEARLGEVRQVGM